jgi:hypothetical protein
LGNNSQQIFYDSGFTGPGGSGENNDLTLHQSL